MMMQRASSLNQTLSISIAQASPYPLQLEFHVGSGDVIALVGPSGSGKTSTLRAIAGLSRPERGRITLGDDVWFDQAGAIFVRPERRRVGMVFQDYALFPHLRVIDNVAIAMGHVPMDVRPNAALEVLKRMGIAALALRRPRTLSGGERQRVGLARALAREPAILLLDEPFSAVDRPTRRKLKSEVSDIIRRLQIPTVLVTHDIEDILAIATRMIVIDGGRALAEGEPAALIARPPTQRVAEIICADDSSQVSNRA